MLKSLYRFEARTEVAVRNPDPNGSPLIQRVLTFGPHPIEPQYPQMPKIQIALAPGEEFPHDLPSEFVLTIEPAPVEEPTPPCTPHVNGSTR